MTRPTRKISNVSCKVNAKRVLCKDVLKPCSIAACNLTYKAAKIPRVKLDIRKPSNHQSFTLPPNIVIFMLKYSQTTIASQHT